MISHLEKTIQYSSYFFLSLIPWQTIFILEEQFINGAKWEYGTLGIYITEIIGWLAVLLFMVWYVLKLRYKFQISNFKFRMSRDRIFVLSLLIFIGYSLIITLFAGDQPIAFQHAQRILLSSLLFLLIYIGPVKGKHALWAFILGSLFVSVFGIWQFLAQSTFSSTLFGLSQYIVYEPGASIIASESIGRWLRAYGSFSHPNVFGGYLVLSMLSSLLLFRNSIRWERVALHGIIVLQTAALFFTFSRSAWMAMFLSLIVLLSLFRNNLKNVRPIISIAVLFIIFTTIYFPLVQTRFAGASSHEVVSITERTAGYGQAFELFRANMWFGVGGENYTYALVQSRFDMPGWWYQPVHSVLMLFVVEYGLVGVLLFIFVIVSFFRYQMTNNKYHLLVVICYLPFVLFDHYLWSSYVGLILLFVYTAVYFRYIDDNFSPHIVPRQSTE
jgi:hypothetical protein